jgi:endo-1,4-beta-xylanase
MIDRQKTLPLTLMALAFASVAAAAACGGAEAGFPDATGGHTATGGTATGGVKATGGAGTGGAIATGGLATGGLATGGVATGGRATGGASTGGVATGGVRTGGYGGGHGGATTGGTNGGTGGGSLGGKQWPKKFCGNITTGGQVRSDFIKYWDQITPENEGKWDSVEHTMDQMNWGGLDRVHDYATKNNIPFKQHNFVWGSQQPPWIAGLSQDKQKAQVEEWIRLFCERYPDTQMIDVVNEPPPHTTPPYVNALGGAGTSGYDWIAQAFKWAHQYCPNAILIMNDYNNIEQSGDLAHNIDIVKRIKSAGAPIDAVGAQSHGTANMSASALQANIDKMATDTGLPVFISEYDLNIADDNQQKNVMQSQFTMFWNDANVKGVTVWGYIKGRTWLANTGLMTDSGTMRPAMTWLMDFLKR